MATFPKFKMAIIAILVLEKMILGMLSTTGCHSAPAYQIWWESANPQRRNGTLMISKMATAAILNFGRSDGTFGPVIQFRVLFCTKIENCAKSLRTWRIYGYCFQFKNSGSQTCWNCNVVTWHYPRYIMHMWKFHSNKLLSFEDINIFIFLRNGLELPNHAPFEDPKKALSCVIRVIGAIVHQNPATGHFSRRVRKKYK